MPPGGARIRGMSGPPLLFDLPGRGAVVLTGKDRVSFLHGIVTNDVKALKPGGGCAAAFLTPKGKLLADCVVLCEEGRLEIDCEPELAKKIEDLLRKYLVFNEVSIGNLTSETAVLHLQHSTTGNAAEESLRKVIGLGQAGALPGSPHAHVTGASTRIVRENRTGAPGYDVRCPSSLSEEIRRAFLTAGARQATDSELESLRIRAGIPRWGFELTEDVLPDEAGLRERGFISDTKGCYVGQETVARIRTYGHVNRKLVSLQVEGDAPAIGTEILFGEEAAGAVTSAARDAGSDRATVLGYVRRERAAPGTSLRLRSAGRDRAATVAPPPSP
jgi:folate-binding protein YgfZ